MTSAVDPADWLQLSVAQLKGLSPIQPRIGLILGSGLGSVVNQVEVAASVPYSALPGLPRSTAIGHRGQFTLGHFAGCPVALMEGRFHLYEGYTPEAVTRPISLMRALGVQTLIVTNAAGGLHPDYRVGDIVVVNDQIDLMGASRAIPALTRETPLNEIPTGPVFDPSLVARAVTAARSVERCGLAGTYIGMRGPNYETRAEYRWLRTIGDLVGMSTIPETLAAHQLGMRTVAFSVVSNECRPDALGQTDGALVVAAVQRSAERMGLILKSLVESETSVTSSTR